MSNVHTHVYMSLESLCMCVEREKNKWEEERRDVLSFLAGRASIVDIDLQYVKRHVSFNGKVNGKLTLVVTHYMGYVHDVKTMS